jgi:hypothetical protein
MIVPVLVAALAVAPGDACVVGSAPAATQFATQFATQLPTQATANSAPTDSTLEALYASGETFERFLAAADDRRRQWEKNWDEATIAPDVLATARGLKRQWRLLVIAVDSCSDSVNTVPYLARLVAEVPGIGMRIISSSVGEAQMQSRRTPDGRPATPTVVILDDAGNEAGCWIERPAKLQALAIEMRAAGKQDEFARDKQAWYDRDGGASTVREVVEALAAAEAGGVRCDARR